MSECCELTCVCQENVELERQLRRKEVELAEAEGQVTQKVDKYFMCDTKFSILCLFLSAGGTANKNSAATGIQCEIQESSERVYFSNRAGDNWRAEAS